MRLSPGTLSLLAAVLSAFPAFTSPPAAAADDLRGITIVELGDGDAARAALLGHRRGSVRYLLTYVDEDGSYAALLGSRFDRHCIAWATGGATNSGQRTFGSAPTRQTVGRFPPLCMPFEVITQSDGGIRIRANNPFSDFDPLAADAESRPYQADHKVIARIRDLNMDWSSANVRRLTIHDIALGPLPLSGNGAVDVRPLQTGTPGIQRGMLTASDGAAADANAPAATGFFIPAGTSGLSSDVLYALTSQRRSAAILNTVFDEAVVAQYGEPTLTTQGVRSSTANYYWLVGPEGSVVPLVAADEETASRDEPAVPPGDDACSRTFPLWTSVRYEWHLPQREMDMGPWGCDVVMWINHNGALGQITQYSMRTVSGPLLARVHFRLRLEELDAIRREIAEAEEFRPVL